MNTTFRDSYKLYMRRLSRLDPVLYCSVILLNLMGLVSISTISGIFGNSSILLKQAAGSVVGVILMTILSAADCERFRKYWKYLYFLVILSLLAVLFFGTSGGGARRWISLGGLTFQPSELAKLLLILFYSEFIIIFKGKYTRSQVFALSTLLILPPFFLILKEPDLSTGIMIILIFCAILFTAGLDSKIAIGAAAAAIPAVLIFLYMTVRGDLSLLGDYQRQRILAWIHPEDYASSTAYQTMNSMTAIGSGRLIGKGISTGDTGTLLGTGFISESQTDFIFAVIGEQFGFIGCCILIVLITIVTVRCYQTASECRQVQGRIICAGMAAWIGLQSYLNIGVATGLLPNTGIPLPFVSYGLTSLLCLYCGLGLVQNIFIRNSLPSSDTSHLNGESNEDRFNRT